MEQISLFDTERIYTQDELNNVVVKCYTQEDLNNAVVKAIKDMSEVLERMSARIKELEQTRAEISSELETMCRRCINHSECLGTGCNPKKKLAEALGELSALREAHNKPFCESIVLTEIDKARFIELWKEAQKDE